MTEKRMPARRIPVTFVTSRCGLRSPVDPDATGRLAAEYDLDPAGLSAALDDARRRWALDEKARLDARDTGLVEEAIKQAERLKAAWDRLSLGTRDAIFRYRDPGDADLVSFQRALAHLANGGVFLRSWPAAPRSRIGPRDALLRQLARYWRSVTGKPASAGTVETRSDSTEPNEGGRFVIAAARLVTGGAVSPDQLREALRGKSRAGCPENTP